MIQVHPFSNFMFCLLIWCFFEREFPCASSFLGKYWMRVKPGAGNSIWVFHVGHRKSTTWTICSSPWRVSWKPDLKQPSQDSTPGNSARQCSCPKKLLHPLPPKYLPLEFGFSKWDFGAQSPPDSGVLVSSAGHLLVQQLHELERSRITCYIFVAAAIAEKSCSLLHSGWMPRMSICPIHFPNNAKESSPLRL